FEILGRGDAAALARDDRERRVAVDHEDRLERRLRVLIAELDQRVDVGECHVVGARRDAVDWLDRAARGIDRHVEAFGLEVAAVERQQKGRLRASYFQSSENFTAVCASAGAARPSATASSAPNLTWRMTLMVMQFPSEARHLDHVGGALDRQGAARGR